MGDHRQAVVIAASTASHAPFEKRRRFEVHPAPRLRAAGPRFSHLRAPFAQATGQNRQRGQELLARCRRVDIRAFLVGTPGFGSPVPGGARARARPSIPTATTVSESSGVAASLVLSEGPRRPVVVESRAAEYLGAGMKESPETRAETKLRTSLFGSQSERSVFKSHPPRPVYMHTICMYIHIYIYIRIPSVSIR